MKLKFCEIFIKGTWCFLIIIVFLSSIKDQQVIKSPPLLKTINYLFPQGWGFFTRNPREENVFVYSINKNKITEICLLNQSIENSFGFSRDTRLKAFDIAILIEKINNDEWISSSKQSMKEHLAIPTIKIKKTNNLQYFTKGLFFIKLKKTVPWKWANLNQEKYTPYQIVKIQVYE